MLTLHATEDVPLLTDLYQRTMAQSYLQAGQTAPATFSLFIRTYPPHRGFFVACGLEEVLRYLEAFAFSAQAIAYLSRTGLFADDFLAYLESVRFTGEVWAIPEGRLFFVDEPVLEVTAPLIEAQLIETLVINQINLQTLLATKAIRCVHAAQGRAIVDFSLRRTHGTDAGMKVARASFVAGCSGTSNVLANKVYDIPITGTMAHAYVTSFPHEIDAFRAFVRSFPERSMLLIDTYDTIAGAHKAVQIAREMAARGQRLQGVRIDSGDLLTLGREVRRILDAAGLRDVQLIGSGGLDAFALEELSRHNAPYDAYGVGTRMGVSADAPWTDMAYKPVRYGGQPVRKLSTGKASLPDAKQVYRFAANGRLTHDVIALREERVDGGHPLLQRVMADGQITVPLPPLRDIRERCLADYAHLAECYKALHDPATYPVTLSPTLQAVKRDTERQVAAAEGHGTPLRGRGLGESH